MHPDKSLPRARRDGLLEETLGEELLLYDQNSHVAHCLSPIAACVWRHSDGERDLTELAELAGTSKDLVADTLHELYGKDLLDAEPALTESAVPGVSRREAIIRGVRYGAAAAGASMIVSASAATPAMAASATCQGCKPGVSGVDCCICEDKTCAEVNSEAACRKYCEEEKTPASKKKCYESTAGCA
jgi:hypothetical protein